MVSRASPKRNQAAASPKEEKKKPQQYNIESEEEKKEFWDSPEELEAKVDQFVEMIRESEGMVCFTGAGISTACGIPDYRSGANTKLPTGPGCWEKRALI